MPEICKACGEREVEPDSKYASFCGPCTVWTKEAIDYWLNGKRNYGPGSIHDKEYGK